MRWEDERYVRLYVRDTADWLSLSFDAQALLCLILRKVDRAGLLPLGKHGKKAVAIVLGQVALWDRLAPALDELLADGCLRIDGDVLVFPNFIEAQEAAQSDAQRQRESRARARDLAAALSRSVTESPGTPQTEPESQDVTPEEQPVTSDSQAVTPALRPVTTSHAESHGVTPCCTVPNQPSLPSELSLVADAPASDDAGPFQRVREVWNRVCVPAGFARAHETAKARKAARARMREAGWFDAFQAACAYMAAEPFYRGASSGGWCATLGWLLTPGNAEKTAERGSTRRASPASPGAAARVIAGADGADKFTAKGGERGWNG